MESRIYLTGFMGVGKSTVGKKLARLLNYGFVDLDRMFEKRYKLDINLFFNKYDEQLFRKLEAELLEETFEMERTVISTGGGTPCHFNGMELMNRYGLTVYLKMDPKSLFRRLTAAKRKRPLVTGKQGEALERYIEQKLKEREPCYRKAMIVVDALNIKIGLLAEHVGKYRK